MEPRCCTSKQADFALLIRSCADAQLNSHACVLQDELLLNESLASSKALSQHLAHLLQQPDSQHAGSASLSHLVQTLQALSRDCLGLTDICLACIVGYTAPEAADSVVIQPWNSAAAAMMFSLLDPTTASTRHAALTEFRERDESERSRSANVQSVKVG